MCSNFFLKSLIITILLFAIQQDQHEKEIEADFKKVRQTKGWLAEKGAISDDQIRFYLLLNPRERLNISEMVANAWRIGMLFLFFFFLLIEYTNSRVIRFEQVHYHCFNLLKVLHKCYYCTRHGLLPEWRHFKSKIKQIEFNCKIWFVLDSYAAY